MRHVIPFIMMVAFLVIFFTPIYSVVVWIPLRAGKSLWYGMPWFIGLVCIFIVVDIVLTVRYRRQYK